MPWILRTDAFVPVVVALFGCAAFQHRYLVPLCARASYVINGHGGVSSPAWASAFLSSGTAFAYASAWFLGRKNARGDGYLLGEYHEDTFQLLLASSAACFGLSCGPSWTYLPVPVLIAESLALWILTRQLRYALLAAFVYVTVATVLVTYRLTFLNESVEILPGRTVVLRKFAEVAMFASTWLMLLVGVVLRAPGGYGSRFMRKYDVTGACLTLYALVLVVMEFALLIEPMPVYSRDNYEIGRVAVYSPGIAYFTGVLSLVVTWHVRAQNLIGDESAVVSTSILVGKILAVVIESSLDAYDSLGMLYRRWAVASLLHVMLRAPYLLKPNRAKMAMILSRKRRDPSAKPISPGGLPAYASWAAILYCAIFLPSVIVAAVRLVIEPLVGLLIGQGGGSAYSTSSKWSEIIGYSASIWGISVLSMIKHFLPDGGAEVWRKVSALAFVVGLFVSFAAPAFPGASPSSSSWDDGYAFQSITSSDAEDDAATGGWGLVSAFLAILLALSGPLELREVRDASGRRDTRQLLRLMIFGMMFGCGLSWFITMQSMSKDIFIPIFVTTFSCMAMSTLGTVAAVMGYFLEAREFVEAEQIANVWAGVAFPVFFVISSVSLSAHAYPFGIGGWASTYLSVCGLLAGVFSAMVRMREEKTPTTRGYGNMGCMISWLCAIIVVYGRYGVAGVGVVGTTSVAGIPVRIVSAPILLLVALAESGFTYIRIFLNLLPQASVLGTILCSPILLLLEGEGNVGSGRKKYQVSSTKSKQKGLILSSLTRSSWFAPLLVGTISVFLASSFYAIFLRGCGLSKFSFLFGSGDSVSSQEDVFSLVYGSARRTTGVGALDDVAKMAKKSVVHTRTMVAAAKLSGSGIWTSSSLLGPLMHLLGLLAILPSLQYLVRHSCYGRAPSSSSMVLLALPLNILTIFIGRGIPSLVAAAMMGLVGGIIQATIVQ